MNNTSNSKDSLSAQIVYRRLISAVIDSGFSINVKTPLSISDKALKFDFMTVDVESPLVVGRKQLFTVVYQPSCACFYLASSKDLSSPIGEVLNADVDSEELISFFMDFGRLMYPSLFTTEKTSLSA